MADTAERPALEPKPEARTPASGKPRPYRLSVAEYERMAEAGAFRPEARLELIEGEIVEMAAMNGRHARAVMRLQKALERRYGDVADVATQIPLRLAASEPEPDLALVRPTPQGAEESVPEAADALLVIEVSDTTLAYDRGTKLSLYAEAGVPEVWILNLNTRRLELYREPEGESYARVTTLEPGEPVAPLAHPDRPLEWWPTAVSP